MRVEMSAMKPNEIGWVRLPSTCLPTFSVKYFPILASPSAFAWYILTWLNICLSSSRSARALEVLVSAALHRVPALGDQKAVEEWLVAVDLAYERIQVVV
jgi:hypothetical protein